MWWGSYCSLPLVVMLPVLFLSSCGTTAPPASPPPATPALSPVVSGLSTPVDVQVPMDGTGRLFVVEQSGTIRIVRSNSLVTTPFLDIAAKVNFDGAEMGLLGLAFHPQFPQNPRFYVNYTRSQAGQAQTVIAEYQVSTSPDQANAGTERPLLTVDQPFTNHKGGQLAFGPDGFLYIGLGDGGSGGDPQGNGQNTNTPLGKLLRIDVDHMGAGMEYAVPADNPFVTSGGRPEIWAYGFRNPWRFSFERGTGRLFVADVGQGAFEEIDLAEKGKNFGWNTMEGKHCFSPSSGCNMSGLSLPIAEYDHGEGIAVIGGYVYKGKALPALAGAYLFGDFGSGTIWKLTEGAPGTWTRTKLLSTSMNISSFGQDAAGEIYVLDYGGSLLKLVAQ